LTDKISYSCSVSLMCKSLKITGFRHRKTNNTSKFLMETGGIVAARIQFLRTVHNFRISGNQIIWKWGKVYELEQTANEMGPLVNRLPP
jgi:hypothetical protein